VKRIKLVPGHELSAHLSQSIVEQQQAQVAVNEPVQQTQVEVNEPVQSNPQAQVAVATQQQVQTAVNEPVENGVDQVRAKNGSKKLSAKLFSVFVAIAVHAVILILAALIVVFGAPKKEAVLVGQYIAPQSAQQKMVKKNVLKQVKRTSSAAPAAASMIQMIKANAVAEFALPEITVETTSPLGMGDSNFGAFGGFGGTGTGVGQLILIRMIRRGFMKFSKNLVRRIFQIEL